MNTVDRNQWRTVVNAYAEWVQEKILCGFQPTLLTFTFDQLRGHQAAIAWEMQETVEAIYATLVKKMFHHPHRMPLHRYPIWICSPDYPVIKSDGGNLIDILRNDGRHVHAVALTPPATRLKTSLTDHFDNKQGHYSGVGRNLFRVHAAPITSRIEFVTDYALKGGKNSRVGSDALFVLPRTRDEVTGVVASEPWEHGRTKIIGKYD